VIVELNLKRPRCENCNRKLYPKSRPWRSSDYLLGDIPPHCPECGKEISREIRDKAENYGAKIFLIQCCCGISFIISLILIIISISNPLF